MFTKQHNHSPKKTEKPQTYYFMTAGTLAEIPPEYKSSLILNLHNCDNILMHYTSISYVIGLWYLCRTFTLKALYSSLALQAWRQKLSTQTVVTHLINISACFDYHEWPVVLNSMILWVLRNIWMFCPFVNDHNNILILVNQVTTVEHIVSITKHSLKTKYALSLCGSVHVN